MQAKNKGIWSLGAKGWYIVIIGFFCYFIGQILGGAGLSNTVVPAVAEIRGFEATAMTAWISYGSWIALPFVVIWAKVGEKIGAKKTIMISMTIAAAAFICFGCTTSFTLWCVAMVVLSVCTFAFYSYGGNALISNWFPTRKGIALGWASMGIMFSDIFWVPYITKAFGAIGLSTTSIIVGAIVLVLVAVIFFTVKEKPEEAGAYPDNEPIPNEQMKMIAQIQNQYKTDWTVLKLLKTKETWIVGFMGALMWMCGGGTIVCFYPRMLSLGYEYSQISVIFQSIAFISLVGSWLLGVIDVKLGTKKAFIICGIIILIGDLVMFLVVPYSIVGAYISAALVGVSIGGVPNLLASMQASIWGRWDFVASSKVISLFTSIFLGSSFLLSSKSFEITGSYNAYFIFICCSAAISLILAIIIKPKLLGKSDEDIMAMFPQYREAFTTAEEQ